MTKFLLSWLRGQGKHKDGKSEMTLKPYIRQQLKYSFSLNILSAQACEIHIGLNFCLLNAPFQMISEVAGSPQFL